MPDTHMYGRLPVKPEGERLALRWIHEYASLLPVVYPIDVSAGVTNWGMLGNGPDPTLTVNGGQPVGDCVPCAYAHDILIAITLGALHVTEYTANTLVTLYLTYDHGQDEGVNIADFLLWLYKQGLISAFAPVALDTVDQVMFTFKRGVILGVNCTDNDQANFQVRPWSCPPAPDPQLGHGVLKIKSIALKGNGTIVTWGSDQDCDASWLADQNVNDPSAGGCVEEAWIILTPDDKLQMGADAWNAVIGDLDALPDSTGPTPAPPAPAPAPAPVPPAPAPAPPQPPGPGPTPPKPVPSPPPEPPSPLPPSHETWWQEVKAWWAEVEALFSHQPPEPPA